MKLLNLLFLSFDDEYYVIESISELEVRERLMARVGNEPSHLFKHNPEPFWGTVGKNEFRVWLNKFQFRKRTPVIQPTTTTGSFRNVSIYNDKILLTIDFTVPYLNIVGALAGTGLFLSGLISLVVAGSFQQNVVTIAIGFIARVIFDLRSLADVNRIRPGILGAFGNKQVTRVSRARRDTRKSSEPAAAIKN
jgi:hypothetical protein